MIEISITGVVQSIEKSGKWTALVFESKKSFKDGLVKAIFKDGVGQEVRSAISAGDRVFVSGAIINHNSKPPAIKLHCTSFVKIEN